jgi:hypothetical protein
MADQDLSSYIGSDTNGPLEPGFNWLSSGTTASDLFSDPSMVNAGTSKFGNALASVGSAFKSATKTANAEAPHDDYGFGRASTIGLFQEGKDRVPLEPTKPAAKTRPAQSENYQDIHRQWYNDMRTWANNGK